MRKLVVVAAPMALAVVLAGCGNSTHSTSPSTPTSTSGIKTAPGGATSPTSQNASGKTAPAVAPPAGTVTTPDGSAYLLTLTPQRTPGPCATPGHTVGKDVPFSVSIKNTGTVVEPLARIGLQASDPAATSSANREVVAILYQGICLNFTEPGGTLDPGATVTYEGTASSVTPASRLIANIISTPDNTTLGSVSLTIG